MTRSWRQLQLAEAISEWFIREVGGAERPSILDIDTTYPALRQVEEGFPAIRAEALAVLADRSSVPTIQQVENQEYCLSSRTPHDWRQFWFWSLGERSEANCNRCPETVRVLERIPGVAQAHLSLLDPGKAVAAHRGYYAGFLRYHLGVVVPAQNPPQLRVHDQFHTWSEGKGVLFDDTREHEVFNTCAEPRVVLILDVHRPMKPLQRAAHRAVVSMARRQYSRPQMGRVRELAGG